MRDRIGIHGIALALFLVLAGCASSGPKPTSDDEAVKRIVANIDIDKIVRDVLAKTLKNEFSSVPHDNSVLWQLVAPTLMSKDILGLRLVSPDRLLLSVEEANPRLIDTNNGSTIWELKTLMHDERELEKGQDKEKGKRKATSVKYPSYACVSVYLDLVVFRADGDGGSKILAVETATGTKRWEAELKKSGELHLIPLPEVEVLLTVQQDKRRAALTAFNLSSGNIAWKIERGYGGGTVDPPLPSAGTDVIWLYYDGVERISVANGKAEWRRPEIVAGRQTPPMQIEEGRLHLIDGKNTLHVLDALSGKTLASAKQRDAVVYTNIFPIGDRVYLRGVEKGKSGEPRFLVAAVRSADGKEIWVDTDNDPSVSNLIDEDGSLYFSTPFTVVALDRETGARRFAVRASDVGKSFPVRIGRYGDRIVYIGELVIAAFDAKTGAKIYRHGFDPVNQTAHMDALNESIESTRKYLSWFTGPLSGWDLKGLNMSNFFFEQATYSQNQSRHYAEQASKYSHEARTAGSGGDRRTAAMKSDLNRMRSKTEAAFSNAQFSMGMAFMTVENVQRGMATLTAPDRARLQQLLRTRRLLYAAYVMTQQGDYVYRPTKESGAVGILVIHLPSGRASYTELTPEHRELGILSLVDFERGVVYYPGIRKEGIVNGYFIARPVTVPK